MNKNCTLIVQKTWHTSLFTENSTFPAKHVSVFHFLIQIGPFSQCFQTLSCLLYHERGFTPHFVSTYPSFTSYNSDFSYIVRRSQPSPELFLLSDTLPTFSYGLWDNPVFSVRFQEKYNHIHICFQYLIVHPSHMLLTFSHLLRAKFICRSCHANRSAPILCFQSCVCR